MNYNSIRACDNYTAVSVNHRALITRTLTKYPVDYALFRELLQNSADAKAKSARITFESTAPIDASQPSSLHTATINKLVFRNDGLIFSDSDWNRLKEIAKGNPDENKIGAFGVGFYSVFELTDTPLVHSGNWVMSFHFVGDELRYSKSQSDQYVDGTLIDIPYRSKDATLPDLVRFIAFLTQSFMLLPLNQVSLYCGQDLRLFEITKIQSPSKPIEIPRKLDPYSFNRVFKLDPPEISRVQVQVTYLNATQMRKQDLSSATGIFRFGKSIVSSFFTSSENPLEETKLVSFLQRVDGTAQVSVSNSFRNKMIETVLKPPAKKTSMSLLTYNKQDMDQSTLKSPLSNCIFPNDFNDAKLVIGFPTKQSTGIKTHLALNQLIPTMERTAVDMSNATVKDWNSELLYVAGILARCVYEHELSMAASQGSLDLQLSYASYTMKRFQMSNSAPDASVGQRFAAGFWRCLNVVAVPTQMGIQPSTKARLASTTPRALIRHTPVLTAADEDNNAFVDQIKQIGYVKELNMTDLATDLQTTPINPELFDELVKWAPESAQLSTIVNAVVVSDRDESGVQGLILGKIRFYQNVFTVPDGMPIPDSCLPHQLASKHRIPDLEKFGWKELNHTVWVEYLVQLSKKPGPHNMVLNTEFAINVLNVLSNGWIRQTDVTRKQISDLLANLNCIPTQNGIKTPSESYLKPIALFPDLPVINSSLNASKQFLVGIGVRESVGMEFVLKVLHDPTSTLTWSSQDLVGYLCDNRKKLLRSDWGILEKGLFFQDTQSESLVSVSTLYAPDSTLASLGFHTLKWKASWQSTSPEAQLLFKLGLKKAPCATALFEQAIKQGSVKPALQYYLAKYDDNHYNRAELSSTNFKIIPTVDGEFVAPKNCYYDMEASHFGLDVISRRFQEFQAERLGVEIKPRVKVLLDYLLAHPQGDSDAMFSYLGTRLSSFTPTDVACCKDKKFIPVKGGFETPRNVFFSGSDPQLASLFCVIKPSDQAAQFLRKVGVQELPSINQIAWRTVNDPTRVYEAFGNGSAYKQLLVRFETEWQSLKSDKALIAAMKSSKFLVGETYDPKEDSTTLGLFCASEISIVDNIIILNQFKHLITACPQESLLEDFYHRLGSSTLSSSLMERANLGKAVDNPPDGTDLKQVICDRLVLFLESTSKETRIKSRQVQNLEIVFVSGIRLDRKLKNTPVVSHATSAYMSPSETNKLYLTVKPDWFQVSGVLTRFALKRPDPESVIVLELQLSSSLESLQRKGYNVNRLLKRQREIEDAKYLKQVRQENLRKKQLEEQRQKQEIEERERQSLCAAQELEASRGAVQDAKSSGDAQPKKNNETAIQKFGQEPPAGNDVPSLANAELPALKAVQNMIPPAAKASGLLGSLFKSKTWSGRGESPSQPAQIPGIKAGSTVSNTNTLKSGISTSKPFSQDNLNSMEQQATPDAPMPVSCRPRRAYDYRVGAKMSDGLKIFVKKDNASPPSDQQVDYAYELRSILQSCAEIYNVQWDAISLYIGELESIAFNTGGSLFFNLDVFIDRKLGQGWNPSKQLDFWFTVMAHELAHNLVADHGEQHSFYTESYIQEYLSKLHSRQE